MAKTRSKAHRKVGAAEWMARAVGRFTASTTAFLLALATVAVWVAVGPLFHYSDTWQLVINTGTTIITFLMVFLIQRTQDKESLALQLKLNELIAALNGASNRLVDVESLSETELNQLHGHFARLASMAQEAVNIRESHSIEEAERRHGAKHAKR